MDNLAFKKLEELENKYQEIQRLLVDDNVIKDQKKYIDLAKEITVLKPIISVFTKYKKISSDLLSVQEISINNDDNNAEFKQLAQQEIQLLQKNKDELEHQLCVLLLPKDPNDTRNVFLEIRAGTGGDEAAIFAGDLFRMYYKFIESKNWQIGVISKSFGEHGGYKEVIALITGHNVYSNLKFESGVHRVQRVPKTEAQGRVHTSTCTVAILPEAELIDKIEINTADLKIDTCRSSGAGGQHVNVTDSAVRIMHLPTGLVVECQDERSQHKNKARALSLLQAKLLSNAQKKQQQEKSATRKNLIGTGDRSERIRTYNFSQGRVTDHRIGLTLYKLDKIMEGNLDLVILPIIQEYQAKLMIEE